MGRVGAYTTYREVIDDPACQEILAATGKSIAAVTAPVTGVLGNGIRGIPDGWVKNGKTLSHVANEPYGYVLLAVLAFLASKGMRISGLADGDGACRLEVIMPAKLSQAIDTDTAAYRERDL